MQEILVYIIIAIAVFRLIRYLSKRNSKKGACCDHCGDCPLKKKCKGEECRREKLF